MKFFIKIAVFLGCVKMDASAGHGLDPKVWGPSAWSTMHTLASVANTPEARQDFVSYINAFAKIIPCSVCKKHFAENRGKFDIRNYMESSESLLLWTYLMHDAVNFSQHKTGKERPSWLEVRARYFKINDTDKDASPGSSEDYDPTICTEICGATVAKLMSKPENTKSGQETKLKILSRNKQSAKSKR